MIWFILGQGESEIRAVSSIRVGTELPVKNIRISDRDSWAMARASALLLFLKFNLTGKMSR